MIRPINIAISPNLELDDWVLALKTLLTGAPKGAELKVRNWFQSYFGPGFKALTFNSGRSAEYAILKALSVGEGDEVLLQAFTCVAVPNSVLWLGAKPVYVDIDPQTYTMDPTDLARKISPRAKAIIIQHTFGHPADMKTCLNIANKHHLSVIEDCAHALGATYQGKKLGEFGAAAFFSFGRDKIISSVFGGVAITSDSKLAMKIESVHQELPESPKWWIIQQLFHPLLTGLILPWYNFFSLGKIELRLAQALRLVSKAVYPKEKKGERPAIFPARFSDELATLALNQLAKLPRFNTHRRKLARVYAQKLKNSPVVFPGFNHAATYLRFTIQTPQAEEIFLQAQKKGMLLGAWYSDVVSPAVSPEHVGYSLGSCPAAERVASQVLNLPTYPTLSEREAETIANKIKSWLK